MKKIFTLCVVLCLSYLSMGATNLKHEFRATWLATVSGIDWPKTPVTNDATREQQKQELIDILDKMKAGNLNAVCFQVRSLCDAMYQSSYEPWSIALTGTRGKDPGYDPLQFAIDEAHKRGMELHVWVNPFRASTSTLAATDMLWDNAGDWLIKYNNSSFSGYLIDPGYPESRAYVVKVLMEIINNYDVDGLVMDDYFYAYGGTTNQDSVAQALHYRASEVIDVNNNGNKIDDWRRSNVDNVIKAMYDSIQVVKPWVRFGMGPGGIWTTDSKAASAYGISLPSGISGSDIYNVLYCNTVEWIKGGYVDYVNPQIYWSTQVAAQDYDVLCQWWSTSVCEHFSNQLPNQKRVHHFPSLATYKAIQKNDGTYYSGYSDGCVEIQRELDANRKNLSSGYTGAVFYNTTSYLQMSEELAESHFTHTALAPPMEWKVKGDLAAPTNLQLSGTTLSWQHPTAERFTVYAYPKGIGVNTATSNPQYLQAVVYDKSFNTSSLGSLDDITIAVYTYDRYGVEHGVALYNADPNATDDPEPEPEPEPEPSNTITWELNGGEVNTVTVEVPTQSDLMLQFMNDYVAYFGTPTIDVDAFHPTGNMTGFLYRGINTREKSVNEMILDETAGWKWLADYIVSTSASNPTIVAALNSGTEVNWRYSIAAFFEQNGSGTYNVDFSTAGQPAAWGPTYQVAHGMVLLPTYVTSAYTLPTPTHPEGLTFLGWYDNPAFSGSSLTIIPAHWTGTLYAQWQENTPTIDPTWQITYTSTDGNIITPFSTEIFFGANIVSNSYENGQGVITFDGPVTSIGPDAFCNCSTLTSITIPNSVMSIGSYAFYGCSSLTSITIPINVTNVEYDVFNHCSSLTSVVWNAKNCGDFSYFSQYPFYSIASQITSFTFGDSVQHIPAYMCYQMSNLVTISIPNSVISIGYEAFKYCASLTSISIPNNVTSFGSYVFDGCSNLTSITIPNNVTSIAEGMFHNCSSLTSITIPNSVISIGFDAFMGCSTLTSIVVPNSVTSIGSYAFWRCSSLTSITIGSSVTSLGQSLFDYCSLLDTIYVEAITPPTSYLTFGLSSSYIIYIPCGTLAAYQASDWANYGANELVERGCLDPAWQITYTSSNDSIVTPYATDVFCANIVSNTYKNGVGTITFDGPVTSIGESAFKGCSSLTSITIPNSVTSIGQGAFKNCSVLDTIHLEATTPPALKDSTIFMNTPAPVCVIPCGTLAVYEASDWATQVGSFVEDCPIVIKAKVPAAWENDDITVWVWTDGAGTEYLTTKEGDWYVYTHSDNTPFNIIFKSGTGWKGNTYQTVDINGITANTCLEIQPTNTKATYTIVDCYDTRITYVLNGGVQSEWETPQAMYNELNALWNTFSGTSKTWGNLENLKANVANGIPTQAGTMALDFIADENFKEKFEWLVTYMDAKCTEQGQTLPSSDASFLRYNLQAFFIDGMRTSWPISADYTICGVSTVEAYQPYWKSGFANPTNPTEEFVLNAPYKEGYTFAGWYTNADFSGEKVTTINSETTGTLYAKWIEYIPTIAEVRALADNTETKVAGVVNFISVTNMYIQDATGGILVSTNDTIDYRVGDRIVVRGVRTIYGGAPKIENAIVVSVEAAALYDVTTFETLKPLISDSIDHKYFATRVTIPGLKIVSYDAYDAYPIVQDLLGNQVACHMMSINPVQFPIGTKVNVTAVAGWYDGLLFVGDADGIELADGPKKDTYDYPVRAERYTLTNDWIYSNTEGNFASNKPGSDNYVRGMAVKDGIMYFINRENGSLTRVDGATGEMLEPLKITGEHLFERIGENGEWESACTLPFNDIKFDQAGNCLIGSCVSGDGTFQIYEVDLETGAATLVVEERLYDNSDFTDNGYRFDAFGVYGDIKSNACVMAADGNGSLDVYRWLITDGKWETADRRTADLSKDDYYWTATSWGTAPQIYPLDERGTYFYVDGFNTYPMLFNEYGTLLEDFYTPTEFNAYNNEGEILTVNAQLNGLQEFQVGNEYFLIIAAGHTNNGVAPSSFVLYKFADDSRSFSSLEPLWYFPANGMGGATNGCRTAPIIVEVEGNKAHLYLYATNNGYARYTLNVGDNIAEPIDPTWQITYTSTDDNIVTPTQADVFGANIVNNTYENGVGTITFDGPVTSIGENAFRQCSSIASITIPKSVKSIGEYAFSQCSYLSSITIPDSVTRIGDWAFSFCMTLTSVTIHDSVTSIGEGAFWHCNSLTSITIPSSVTNIGYGVFGYCYNLASLVIEEGNTIYDSRDNCNAIIETTTNTLISGCQNTIILNNVTSIGAEAFYGCSSLTSIILPNSVTNIGEQAFANCSGLTSITLPNSVMNIGDQAFVHCSRLDSITLPNSVTSIGEMAFLYCSSLDTIHVEATTPPALEDSTVFMNTPAPVCFIPCGSFAAYKSSAWASQVGSFVEDCVEGQQIYYTSTDGNIVTPYATDVFGANIVSNTYENGVGTITFDGPVTSIGDRAFRYCTSLTSITIPNSVMSIGDVAFYHCTSLASVVIPESVTSIGDWAFSYCTSLASVVIPESVTSIGDRAFVYCSGLTSVTIPNSVTSIGDRAFVYCSGLTSVTIPNSVTSIGDYTFLGCSSITSMVVESGNTTYDSRENCNAIIETATNTLITGCQNTVIPNSVTSIGQTAFYCCYSLRSIALPNNITTIGDSAFFDCTSLMSVTIPGSVRLIGTNAFYNCTNIAKTNFLGDIEDWCNIEFERYSSNPITYSHNLYINDQEINDVVIPNTIDSIKRYTFYRCASLTSVTLPDAITTIGERAFTSCTSLKSLTIPESVTFIADAAFALCESLETMYTHAITPPILEGEILFTGSPISTCYIPCGSLAAYEASAWATQVSEFIEEGCPTFQMCGDDLYWEYADGLLTITGMGDMYDYAADTDVPWYDVRGNIKTVSLPDAMTKIGQNAFYKCTAMTSINMPTSLTAIGEKAFAQDTKLACEIILPASMTNIASRAFFNCQAVPAFHVEATTPPTIPNDAFDYTTAPIHVPCGYGHIYGKHAQWGVLNLEMCELLQDNVYYYPIDGHTARAVTYHSNPTDTIVIPSAVVIDGMPRTVTEVADFAFTDCANLPAISFNEGLEYIGERAFVRCYGLHGTIVLPATLETIGERAFSYCDNVEKYILQAMTPPALANDVFTGSNSKALFYISCEAMDDYKVATNWSSLKSRLRDACLNIYHYNTALGANGVHTTEDTLVASIYYRRQFTPNSWETLYLPFEVDRVTVLEEGVEYDLIAWNIFGGGHYYLAKPYGIENKEVVFGFTQMVDAHTPYIIQFKDVYYRDKIITFYGKESWNKLSTSFEMLPTSFEMQMAGNTTLQNQILEEPVYMLRGASNFILQNTTTTLHPFECYVMPYATSSATPTRMNVRFRGDVPTAVESVKGNESHLTYTVDGYTLTVYPQGQAFSIYSLNGALIYSCEAGKEAVDCELNSGCYLLHAGTEAHKIML